jgi:hypothetical protein
LRLPKIAWENKTAFQCGTGFVTPASLHYGQAKEVIAARQQALKQAYLAKPRRVFKGIPQPIKLPTPVWINLPVAKPEDKKRTPEVYGSGVRHVASLTYPRSAYPSTNCVPAELASGSADHHNPPNSCALNTKAMPDKILGVRGQAPDYNPLIH